MPATSSISKAFNVRRNSTWAIRAIALVLFTSCAKEPAPAVEEKMLTSEEPDSLVAAFFAANFPNNPSVAGIGGYNDQQKLPGHGNDDYGALVRLYVAPRAPTASELAAGAIVGLMEVEGGDDTPAPAYTRLGIQNSSAKMLYCIFLKQGNPQNPWDGYVTPLNGTTCTPLAPSNKLQASEADATQSTALSYVARFVEDNAGMPAIGVGCLTSFCHLGRAVGNGHSPMADEQQLALPTGSGTPPLHRGMRGRVTPVPGLGGIKKADFQTAPQKVGVVWLETAPDPNVDSKYRRWGLAQGDNGLWLTLDSLGAWHAQFVPGANAPVNQTRFAVNRPGDHPAATPVPADVRWVWNPNDEDIWVACDQGCCTITGGEGLGRGRGRGRGNP